MDDAVGAVEAEAAYAAMARTAGIEMAPVQVLRASSGEPFFVTDRFDRDGNVRLHMQTVAALLDVDFRSATLDYVDLLKLVRVMTRDQRAVEEMFRRMVFNIRMLNRDDHLKNHAFLMDRTGNWRLSPAYDLSFSRGLGGEHTLLIAGEGRRPGRVQIYAVAVNAGISPNRVGEIVDQMGVAVAGWGGVAMRNWSSFRRNWPGRLRRRWVGQGTGSIGDMGVVRLRNRGCSDPSPAGTHVTDVSTVSDLPNRWSSASIGTYLTGFSQVLERPS
ncbi:HipA domain-containing protein [Rhodobacteraceae bacterium 2376]|uniref:HipA domain-containing protein n=1 Tax=Rhabdonatronobacter sediminivivens TaxID=2743469 RepID=A0A7Z0L390_9RHOB|nr:HipA domain-containing protein [Rhabdonatronobacter sediminivivens]